MANEQNPSQLASELRTVVSRLVKKLRSKTKTGEKLSLTERSTMKLLDEHKELLPSELAVMEKITTQSMSQIISHLLELGYINRRESDTDKRKSIISLSNAGQDVLYTARNERDEWLRKALRETCTEGEQEILQQAIVPLTKLVDFE